MVQQTISVFFIAVVISQLFCGVLSERLGRKPVALIAAILFAMGSWCCAQADSVELLIEARAIQGLGVGGLYLLCRTILQDSYTNTGLMSILAWFGVLFTIFVFGSGLITTVVAVSALYLFPNHKGQAGSICFDENGWDVLGDTSIITCRKYVPGIDAESCGICSE